MHLRSNAVQQRFLPQPVSAQGRPLVKLATACHSEGQRPEESIKIQGTKERYALRKQRGSTKVLAAASERSRAAPCQAGNSLQTFYLSPIRNASINADCGTSTLPNWRILSLPFFCLSKSLRLRVISPP